MLTGLGVAAACLLALELVMRLLPVATGLNPVDTDAATPIFHFEPGFHYVYSRGWDLRGVNEGRVNNAGWVNDQDYRRDDPRPLIAVIGNSFIEAQMVPYGETLQGRLAASLADRYRVYSFAASSASLAQFVIYARYAVQNYGASAIVIAYTSFGAGWPAEISVPGLWSYAQEGGDVRMRLVPYRRGRLVRVARRSALLRYLAFNLMVQQKIRVLQADAVRLWRGSAPSEAGDKERSLALGAAFDDAFFRDLSALGGLPKERFLLLADGFRYPERAAAFAGSIPSRRRDGFIAAASANGYPVIDLDPLFFERYRATGDRFEFGRDPHWNAEGHGIVADTVLASSWLADLSRALH